MGKNNNCFWNFLEEASERMNEIKNSTPEELAEKYAEESIAELQKSMELKTVETLYKLALEYNQLKKLLVDKKILDKAEVEKIESESSSQTKEWREMFLAAHKAYFKEKYLKYFTEVKAEMDKGGGKV